MKRWMIYGANGFTGKITAEEAARRGMKPVLAGRHEEKIAPLAKALNLEYRIFDLKFPESTRTALEGIDLVLHCAGPFSKTSSPMVEACLAKKTHYLDITGEIEVFENIFSKSNEAKSKGVVLLPGVGFDVVPSDCLAKKLFEALPNATDLELAFTGSSRLSPGTLKTMLENVDSGGRVRAEGKIIRVGQAYKMREVSFSIGKRSVASIPWGDVSTAYHSTGIPNIVVYAGAPRPVSFLMKALQPFQSALGAPPVQKFLKKQIEKHVHGPTPEEMEKNRMYLWGEVRDGKGKVVQGRLEVEEGYRFTRDSSLEVVKRLLEQELPGGSYTPSMAFGSSLVESVPRSGKFQIEEK
jgi:short subunit dehydrogenase-like uncharacterized protein